MEINDLSKKVKLTDNNKIIGKAEMKHSKIVFRGKNNILYLEDDIKLHNSTLEFNVDNSLIYLSKNSHYYMVSISVNNNDTVYIGKNCYFNGIMNITLPEETNVFIGNDGVFSFGIWVRTADPHLIYSMDNKKRINPSRSVFIGDHVWLGQNSLILKGTKIDSGSIIGAKSVVSGKKIPSNQIWAGNPVRFVKKGIFWDGASVNRYTPEGTIKSSTYESFVEDNKKVNRFIYSYNKEQEIDYNTIDKTLTKLKPKEKMEYLKELSNSSKKNRFVHFKTKRNIIKRGIRKIKRELKKK